ncbi:hypothetical protein HAM_015 (mitochondrion) [Hemiselmis andersenii]|uniref:Ribosomal protein S1 n=1 Tax=Hemiselmis andersenii TaxID=464988 RepID=B2MWT0_HEMAN|nr:hypothetical protein HAM_015 [Hemiselmis andersenii]ACC78222.1 hypothetical protein HAM_015 [Hemiselmis andersenii]
MYNMKIIYNMSANLKIHKFNSKSYMYCKDSTRYLIPVSPQLVEGSIEAFTVHNSFVLIDFGFKREIELFSSEFIPHSFNSLSLTEKFNSLQKLNFFEFKVLVLEHFFLNETLIKKSFFLNFNIFFWLLSREKKRYVKCRILNVLKGGYSVGIGGFVGFLPYSRSFLNYSKRIGFITTCRVTAINISKKRFVVSQKRIDTIFKRQLVNLWSRLCTIKKSRRSTIKKLS